VYFAKSGGGFYRPNFGLRLTRDFFSDKDNLQNLVAKAGKNFPA
jgi:hypothetical protein